MDRSESFDSSSDMKGDLPEIAIAFNICSTFLGNIYRCKIQDSLKRGDYL